MAECVKRTPINVFFFYFQSDANIINFIERKYSIALVFYARNIHSLHGNLTLLLVELFVPMTAMYTWWPLAIHTIISLIRTKHILYFK